MDFSKKRLIIINASQIKQKQANLINPTWIKFYKPYSFSSHINKQTTYENPYLQQQLQLKQQQQQQQQQLQQGSMKTFKPSSSSNTPINMQQTDSAPHLNGTNSQPQAHQGVSRRNIYFTQNPNELKGEFLKTSLLKTPHGFGFTIIGANETSEDFLQIKFIVPDGAAARDNSLRQGDVLVYVNNECVLGYTHQDVVEIFQSIPVGNSVELTVCRGYPLSIDPNDPNIEIMPLAAINNPNMNIQQQISSNTSAPLAAVDELTASTLLNGSPSKIAAKNSDGDEYYCEEYEEMYAPIVKGPKGFGFTIADDSQMNHQKVKQILDKERCCNLQENDILLEINGVDLRNLSHNQVVEVLKECVRGQETIIKLKRRKYQIVLPQPPANSNLLPSVSSSASSNNEVAKSFNKKGRNFIRLFFIMVV